MHDGDGDLYRRRQDRDKADDFVVLAPGIHAAGADKRLSLVPKIQVHCSLCDLSDERLRAGHGDTVWIDADLVFSGQILVPQRRRPKDPYLNWHCARDLFAQANGDVGRTESSDPNVLVDALGKDGHLVFAILVVL